MAWWNPKTWFKKSETPDPAATAVIERAEAPAIVSEVPRPTERQYGTFVEVFLEYGFGQITPCPNPDSPAPFRPCLYIPDLDCEATKKALDGHVLDWRRIPSSYRAHLELGAQFYRESWSEVRQFLKAI